MEKVKEIFERTKRKIEKEKMQKVTVMFLVVTEHKKDNQVEVESFINGEKQLLDFGLDKIMNNLEN